MLSDCPNSAVGPVLCWPWAPPAVRGVARTYVLSRCPLDGQVALDSRDDAR